MADAKLSVASGVRIALRASDGGSAALRVGAEVYAGESDYERLSNKPRIEGVELVGDRGISEFGVTMATELDIIGLFK